MTALVLEDDINRISQFRKVLFNYKTTYTDSASNCIYLLEHNKYDLIFLDHDLDNRVFVNIDEKNTGSEVARWINLNYNNFLNKDSIIIVHSLNDVGSTNMIKLIPNSKYVPLIWIKTVFDTNIGKK